MNLTTSNNSMNLTTSNNSYVTSRDGMYVLVQNEYDRHTHCFLNELFDFKTYNLLPLIRKIKNKSQKKIKLF